MSTMRGPKKMIRMKNHVLVKTVSLLMSIVVGITALGIYPVYADETKTDGSDIDIYGMTEKQRNSLAMLNYLVVLSDDINSHPNNRLYLEERYSSIISNLDPKAVDNETNDYLNKLLKTIDEYGYIDVKKERIDLVREIEQAQAIRSAIPNPVGLLSAVSSGDPVKIVASVIYMSIDSISGYQSAIAEADLKYLQDGWELEDEAKKNLQSNRSNSWNYLRSMVNEYGLPSELTLSENAIKDFVKTNIESGLENKTQYFEDKEAEYSGYAGYWKARAECYYDLAEKNPTRAAEYYEKCLNSISRYESTQAKIFRKDHDLAQLLPKGIIAAKQIYTGNKYIVIADDYIQKIKDNIEDEDWTLRYFVAVTQVDLYNRTKDTKYLESAYELIRTSVNLLGKKQWELNQEYTDDVKLAEYDKKKDSKQRIKEAKEYNELLKEERKTELPPIYEPLRVNCELLRFLADELKKSKTDREWIDKLIHQDDKQLFLTSRIDKQYWFADNKTIEDDPHMTIDNYNLIIPVQCLSKDSDVSVEISNSSGTTTPIGNWTLEEVDRNKSKEIADFKATYSNKDFKKYKFADGDIISIKVISLKNSSYEPYVFKYRVKIKQLVNISKLQMIDTVEFEPIS